MTIAYLAPATIGGNAYLAPDSPGNAVDASATLAGIAVAVALAGIGASGGTSIAGTANLSAVAAGTVAGLLSASGGAGAPMFGLGVVFGEATVSATVGAALGTHVAVRVVDPDGQPRRNLSGLKWAFFDQPTIATVRAPVAQGTNGSTDADGYMTLPVTGTTLQPGQVGVLAFSDSNGDVMQMPPANSFLGPATVA